MPRLWRNPEPAWESATIGGALRWAMAVLTTAGDDSPQLDAEVLLAHVLGVDRAHLYARPEQSLSHSEQEEYRSAVARRQAHEPVPYITGLREFYGLDLIVNRDVLIPRPETELLVEQVLVAAQRWAGAERLYIADVGTGSGAVSVSVAKSLRDATVYAIDSSSDALRVAGLNAVRHKVESRIQLLLGDLLAPLPTPVHVIAANLPYIPSDQVHTLMPDVACYEPHSALDGGSDGLDKIRALLDQAGEHLIPGGVILLEIGADQGEAVKAHARLRHPLADIQVLPDLAGLDRVVRVVLPASPEGNT